MENILTSMNIKLSVSSVGFWFSVIAS